MSARGALAVFTLSTSAFVALSAMSPAQADTYGGRILGSEPGDRWVRTLDRHDMVLRTDGGWAYCFVIDGGYDCRLTSVERPRGYYEPFADGGWAVVEFRADGGTLRMWPVKPPGY